MSNPTIQGMEIVGVLTALPPILVAILAGIPQRRRTKRLEAEGAPFGAEIKPVNPRTLRRFNAGQRAWIRRQLPILAAFPAFCWIFFVYFSSGLLPQFVATYAGKQPLPLRVWWSYLFHVSNNCMLYTIFAVVAGGIAIMELIGQARFLRTRPVSSNFLFFTRVGAVLSALVASVVVAAGLSFVLLLAIHGPVMKHLADESASAAAVIASAPQQAGPSLDDVLDSIHSGAGHLLWAAQTSLPQLFLSILTTLVLGFSIFVAVAMVPVPGKILRILFIVVTMYSLFIGYISYVALGSFLSPTIARGLFFYVHPGPAPPLAFALVPIAISAALLAAAGFLNQRYDC